MSKRVLILGGSGFVGSYLRDELAHEFEVETTSSSGAGATHTFDIMRPEHHSGVVLRGRHDVIVNCIVRRDGTFAEMFAVNVRGLAELALILREMPVHFVQISSVSATMENRHRDDYGFTKFLADEILLHCQRGASFRGSSLRFGQIFDLSGKSAASQPGLHRWVSQLRAREPIEVFAGSGARRSYLPVQTVARAVRHCIERELTGIHDVIAPDTYTPLELATLLVRYAGCDPDRIQVSHTRKPFEYAIPECSPEYRSWLAGQEPCAEYFRRLVQNG